MMKVQKDSRSIYQLSASAVQKEFVNYLHIDFNDQKIETLESKPVYHHFRAKKQWHSLSHSEICHRIFSLVPGRRQLTFWKTKTRPPPAQESISLFSQTDCDTGDGVVWRHAMNLTFLSTIGSSSSCTFWLCKFESLSGLRLLV